MPSRILCALVAVLFVPGIYLTLADLLPAPHQEDFAAYFVAARALTGGESPYDAHAANRAATRAGVEHHSRYIYPPLLAVLLRPLTALPYRAAAAVWFALSAGALLGSLYLLRPIVGLPWRVYGWVCAAVFFLPPVHHTLQHGQITNFLVLLIVAAAGASRGRAVDAGWIGAAAALKVFPVTLAIVYGFSGHLAALAALVTALAILTLAGGLAAPVATADFIARVGPQLALDPPLAPNNQSLGAVAARWFETHWFVTPIIHAPAAGRFASYVGTVIVIGLTLRALLTVRRERSAAVQPVRLSLVVAATLIVWPIVWDHYYVLLLLPVAVLYQRSGDTTVRLLLLAGAVLVLAHRYWPLAFAMKSPLFMSAGLAGVVVMWIALLKVLRYDRVCAVRPQPSVTKPSTI